jgi:hypothetical protein
VLANKDVVALQHSDVANLAGYLSLSIPVLSFYLTKGAAAMGSQVAGSVLSSGAFTSAGVAATTADGNWSFNNMSMDNVSQNKMDTNLMQRQGQQTWQADNGSTQTQTAGGHTVIDGSGAMSNLPVNMKLSQLASSGFQESARQSQVQAQTALDGYNHSVTSGWSQLSQLSNQTGTSDSLIKGSENSQATNATRGAGMMLSAAESYAKANNISTQEAYNKLMDISNQGLYLQALKVRPGGLIWALLSLVLKEVFQAICGIRRAAQEEFRIQIPIRRICDMIRTARQLMTSARVWIWLKAAVSPMARIIPRMLQAAMFSSWPQRSMMLKASTISTPPVRRRVTSSAVWPPLRRTRAQASIRTIRRSLWTGRLINTVIRLSPC